jgi:polyisoprenoid-binding protein YceI
MIRANIAEGEGMGRTGRLVVVAVVVMVLTLAGGYLLLASRTSGSPPPAALDPAPPTTAGETTETTRAGGAASPDGTWQVSGNGASFVGYRVKEQLAFLSAPNQAVGRTRAVTGTMEVAGDTVEKVRIEADLTQLASDESRRDNAIRQRGLESDRFPTATLELAEPIRLDSTPAKGEAVRVRGRGRLTVHGVTREVDLDITGRWSGSTIQVAGQFPVRMTDYQIQPPRFGPVVSIEDAAAVDFNLVFERG